MKYNGSSFFELLNAEQPNLVPDFSLGMAASNGSSPVIPHGTTVIAMKFGDGVIVAGDRLATAGHSVASRDVVKVFETDKHSLMAISGAAGPCIEMAKILAVELEHYEKIEGVRLELDGKANKLSGLIRANMPAAMQGLAVIPLFAGFDTRRKVGRLWSFDVTGGRYEERNFDATGSGGIYASESLKHHWSATMDRDAAVHAAVAGLTAAADEDRATGGVDIERGIYPIIKICTSEGQEDASESEIAACYRSILAARSAGGNL